MTERGRNQVARNATSLQIGPSSVEWTGSGLKIEIDELAAPLPLRVRGTVHLFPNVITEASWTLDTQGLHRWTPIAPSARIEVRMQNPSLNWQGRAYFDGNNGDIALEDSFTKWHWSRSHQNDQATALLYDVTEVSGARRSIAARIDRAGVVTPTQAPPEQDLPPTPIWRIARSTQSADESVQVVKTLEDTPFYARSILGVRGQKNAATELIVHESLDLQRFRSSWVRSLLPFRMPRRIR
jgi:carotenoid 1,2-hydratase